MQFKKAKLSVGRNVRPISMASRLGHFLHPKRHIIIIIIIIVEAVGE
jgi:hypothetical protein